MSQVIDSDGHVVEPPAVWNEYTDREHRDGVIQVRRNRDGRDELWINGENRSRAALPVAASMIPGGLSNLEKARTLTWDDVPEAGWNPASRLKVMDAEGIDLAVLYPSLWLLYGDLVEPRLAAASCRAYNNWMADFCNHSPQRLYAVAPMPLQDVGEAIREMRRVVLELKFKAVFVRPNPFNQRRLNDPAYEPFWRTAQDLGVAVAVHSSFGTRMPTMGADRYRDPFFFHMVCHPFEQQGACMDVICGGVLEKFPKLRVGFLESGVGWLGYWLDRMDEHFEGMHSYVPWMRIRPSEQFREHCFVTLDPHETMLKATVLDMKMQSNILWGSDFPHFDCTYPGIVNEVNRACAPLPEPAREAIITTNAVKFYGF
jgi:predicted TIM-barrel fold metal-dependent hydrolase